MKSEGLKILDVENCENLVNFKVLIDWSSWKSYVSLGALQLEGWIFQIPGV